MATTLFQRSAATTPTSSRRWPIAWLATLQKPLAPATLETLYAGTRAAVTGTGNAVLIAGRGTWVFLRVAFDLKGELLRMADEWEDTLPEQAARLRLVARKGWDW